MQKMAATKQTGTRPDETGMKRKIGTQYKTLHHGTLETILRYLLPYISRAFISNENNDSNIRTGTYKLTVPVRNTQKICCVR
jgi:hypothetical protein